MADKTKQTPEEMIAEEATNIVAKLRNLKPGDRSETDRHYAIVITYFEVAIALFKGFIMME